MRYLLLSALLPTIAFGLLIGTGGAIEPATTIDVWPSTAPGETGDIGEEHLLEPKEGQRLVDRLANVSKPTLTVYKPDAEKDTGAAVLICPGGGYNILAMDLEGTEVVEWLNSIGVTGIVLKYRVPRRKDRPAHEAPLQDAQRAMRLCRANAKNWGIDPERIGILGFSAGGNLSARACTAYGANAYEPIDTNDELSCRPDFGVLVYPAYLLDEEDKTKLSPDLTIDADTPPMFFAHAADDRIPASGSATMFFALREHAIPAELHIYSTGGHGFGLRPSDDPCSTWPESAERWMRRLVLLEKSE